MYRISREIGILPCHLVNHHRRAIGNVRLRGCKRAGIQAAIFYLSKQSMQKLNVCNHCSSNTLAEVGIR